MDPISSLAKLMAALRRQHSSSADRTRTTGGKGPSHRPEASGHSNKPSVEQLERRIAERLRKLDAIQDGQKATRTFLESVLTWEFGTELIQDPRFAEMVHEIECQIRSDPDLSKKLDALLRQMMSKD